MKEVAKMNQEEMTREILDRLIKIETQFSDMHEKVRQHDNFINREYPKHYEFFNTAILKVNIRSTYIVAVSSAIGASALSGLIFLGIQKIYGG
jgi:hypothetical protein